MFFSLSMKVHRKDMIARFRDDCMLCELSVYRNAKLITTDY